MKRLQHRLVASFIITLLQSVLEAFTAIPV